MGMEYSVQRTNKASVLTFPNCTLVGLQTLNIILNSLAKFEQIEGPKIKHIKCVTSNSTNT